MPTVERVALLTRKEKPRLFGGERLLRGAFDEKGIRAEAVPWDVPRNWRRYQGLILRTATWDIASDRGRDEFLAFMHERAQEGIPIYNPEQIVRPNTDKRYLFDLKANGVNIIPTVLFDGESEFELQRILALNDWDKFVIKPTVGASSHGVEKFNVGTADQAINHMSEHVKTYGSVDWLVQKFIPEINTQGELSLVFIDRKFSHAILKKFKKPSEGVFQMTRKNKPDIIDIESGEIKHLIPQAEQVLNSVDGPLLYARVDGINTADRGFLISEFEATDPYLYLEHRNRAPQEFVDAYRRLSR